MATIQPNPRYKKNEEIKSRENARDNKSPPEQPEQPPKEHPEEHSEKPPQQHPEPREPPQSNKNDPIKPKRNIQTTEDTKNVFEMVAYFLSLAIAIVTFPFSVFLCLVIIKEFERAVIFRLGRIRKGARGPGIVWILPCIDGYFEVDLRTTVAIVPTQDVLTKDSVTIRVDAVLHYFIYNPMDAVIQVANVHEATLYIAQTTLRNVVGSKALTDLLVSREALSKEVAIAVAGTTEQWGVKVERVELKDISLPESLQRALASEAEALREARAKIISAKGELSASKALKEASDVMSENQITLQLRHLQILTSIATERNCSIIFPFPMELMTPFQSKSSAKKKNKSEDQDDQSNPFSFGLPFFTRKSEQNDQPNINASDESEKTNDVPPQSNMVAPKETPAKPPKKAPRPRPPETEKETQTLI